jgi:hypothetical protein
MRLIQPLLIFICLLQGVRAATQTISLSVKNASIQKVFELIEKQAGVIFFYTVESLKKARKITMRLTKAWLKEALERCFQNQPLIYEVIDKTIVVKDKLLTSSQTTPLPIS